MSNARYIVVWGTAVFIIAKAVGILFPIPNGHVPEWVDDYFIAIGIITVAAAIHE